jgi:pantoate--beta-alanine ligase
VTIVGVPTVREADGLALSSRNRRLSAEERRVAPFLYQTLQLAGGRISAGHRDAREVREEALAMLKHREIRVEYIEIVDPDEMRPVDRIDGPVRIAAAIWLGSIRLIDNLLCAPA